MSRTETILRVFVASPSDVIEERQLLEEIIQELNITWSKNMGVRLELVKWETHTFPGIGADAQAVINTEIDDDYDIFIGIMWTRFGSPTCRAESGTEEEFNKAYSRYKANPDSVKIMFYFKDVLIAPSAIDPAQLAAINKFKEQLGEQGAFYWTYKERDGFESLLRLHLSRQVQSWIRTEVHDAQTTIQGNTPTTMPTSNVDSHLAVSEEEDEGFMDLFERAMEHYTRGMDILKQMGNENNSLREKIERSTAEMDQQNKSGNFDVKAFKRIHSHLAEDMLYYTSRIEADLPYFSESNKIAFDSIARAVTIYLDFNTSNTAGIEGILSTNVKLLSTITSAGNVTKSFRNMIAKLPRLTTDFNKAKRATLVGLDKLIDEIANMANMINEANNVIRETIAMISKKPSQSDDASQ